MDTYKEQCPQILEVKYQFPEEGHFCQPGVDWEEGPRCLWVCRKGYGFIPTAGMHWGGGARLRQTSMCPIGETMPSAG
jgi:hypothetical protein